MRIGLNLFLLSAHSGGVGNYVMTLLREWPGQFPDHPLVLFTFDRNETMLRQLPAASRRHEIRLPHQGEIHRHLDELDVYFCPFGSLYPRPLPKPSVVLIVDIQEYFFPQFFSRRDRRGRAYHYTWSLRMADRIITISDFSRKSLEVVAGTPPEKISRIYLCADELPAERKRPPLPPGWEGSFIFYPAHGWPHKNHDRLLEALARMPNTLDKPVRTVLTGADIKGSRPMADRIHRHRLTDRVVHLGQVSRSEMAWLYRNARLLVIPSLFEGFGIPLVEAMQSGLPIACSRTTSLPEVGGEAAAYFDPENPVDMAVVMEKLWDDEARRRQLARAGQERAHLFNPTRMLREHLDAFTRARNDFTMSNYQRQHRFDRPVSQLWRFKSWINPDQLRRARALLDSTARP